jgi:hypothetical protein
MKTFNGAEPGDLIEFEMRVKETQRRILQQMFVSSEENKVLLNSALERATARLDIVGLLAQEAESAIQEAIKHYFQWGEGKTLISKAVTGALQEIMPRLFAKDEKKS